MPRNTHGVSASRRVTCRGRRRRGGRRRAAPLTATRARRRAPARTCRGRVRRCRAGTGIGRHGLLLRNQGAGGCHPNRRRGTAARPMALRWSHQPHRLSDRARVGSVRRCRAGSGRMPPNRRRGTAARPMALRWSHQPHRLSDRARVGSVDQRQALDQLVNSIHPVHPAGCAGTTTLAGLQRTRFSKRDRDQGIGASAR